MAGKVSAIRTAVSKSYFSSSSNKKAKNPLPNKKVQVALAAIEKGLYPSQTTIQELIQAIKIDDDKKTRDILYDAINRGENLDILGTIAFEPFKKVTDPKVNKFKCNFCKAVVQEVVKTQNVLFLERALAKSFMLQEEPMQCIFDALQDLKDREPHKAALLQRITNEIEKIAQVPWKRHKLTPLDSMAISLFAEKKLEELAGKTQAVYYRGCDEGINRSLVVDPKRHTFTILSKKYGTLEAEGTFKKVTDAVEVSPFQETASAHRVVRMVSKIDHEISDREIELEERYGQILSWTRYPAKNRPYETKTCIIQEAYDSDLYLFTKYTSSHDRKKLSTQEIVEILSQVTQTLHQMHEDGFAHHDFKVKNVLIRRNQKGKIEAKLIDFGHSFRINKERYAKKRAKGYGTLRYTSPDTLEHPKDLSDINLLAKADDMFALGCLMYEVYFQKRLPWADDTYKACKDKENKSHRVDAVKIITKKAHQLYEMSRDTKDRKESEFLKIMSRLLEPDPRKRMKIAEFLVALSELKARF